MVSLINAYTGVMTALLTVPKLEPITNTLEEAGTQGWNSLLRSNHGFVDVTMVSIQNNSFIFINRLDLDKYQQVDCN